jgi:hypothetical protein
MTLSATDDAAKLPARSLERGVIIALKLLVTGFCFWYLLRKVDVNCWNSAGSHQPSWR